MFRRISAAVAIAAVLFGYYFFMTAGTFGFPVPADPKYSHYASLAEGFRHGHLYLSAVPDEQLAALPDPYDPKQREGVNVLWDGSYFKGRYYLYFSPLPALLVYLPWHFVFGRYPGDYFVACFFAAWAFVASVAFLLRAVPKARLPVALWILFIGFANFTPYSLSGIAMYEITILAGAAMTATWAYATMRFYENPRTSTALRMPLFLALAIAARPNLGVLLLVTIVVLIRRWRVRYAVAAALPLAVAAVAMLWYNAARFGNPFEFGHRYQLTGVSMAGRAVCRVRNIAELRRMFAGIVHYVFWPFSLYPRFPFIELHLSHLDPAISYPAREPVLGLLFFTPAVLVASAVCVIRRRDGAAIAVLAGGWLIVLGLSTCWYVVARYELDFLYLMTASSAVIIEAAGFRTVASRACVALLVVYSIAVGLLLGFDGRDHQFQRLSPARFHMSACLCP